MRNALSWRLAVATCGTLLCAAAAAQDYPNRPIKIIVPFSPGGAVDGPTRAIAVELGKRLARGSLSPVEAMELDAPIRVRRWQLVPDSGGAGRFRGQFAINRKDYGVAFDSPVNPIENEVQVQWDMAISEPKPAAAK